MTDNGPDIYDGHAGLIKGVALLSAVYSRTFGVCAICPHGGGAGTPVTHWHDLGKPLGKVGFCGAHADGCTTGENKR